MNCPGSVAHLATHPMPTSEYALEGRSGHSIYERALLGADYLDHPDQENILEYVSYIKNIHTGLGEGAQLKPEVRVCITSLSNQAFGTADAIVWKDFDELHIFDAKLGWQYVSEHNNSQFMYYALGAIDTFDLNPTKVIVHVFQPAHDNDDQPWRSTEVSMSQLMDFKDELKLAIEKVESGCSDKKIGSWCQFCNRAECEAIDAEYKEATGFDLLTPVPRQSIELESFSTAKLLRLKELEPLLSGVIKDAKAILMSRANEGQEIPGYKLVKSKGNRAWKDEPHVVTGHLRERLGTDLAPLTTYYELKLRSPAQMAKQLSIGKSKEEKKVIKEVIDELVERPDRGVKMVPESAPGEAVLPEKFNDVEDL